MSTLKRVICNIIKKISVKRIDYEDIIIRCVKTFFQAFIYEFPLEMVMSSGELWRSTLRSALTSAGIAGVSAVWNYIRDITKPSEKGGKHD